MLVAVNNRTLHPVTGIPSDIQQPPEEDRIPFGELARRWAICLLLIGVPLGVSWLLTQSLFPMGFVLVFGIGTYMYDTFYMTLTGRRRRPKKQKADGKGLPSFRVRPSLMISILSALVMVLLAVVAILAWALMRRF
jgi:hypothetical protein